MATPDSRDMIHAMLANNQANELLRAAICQKDVASVDGDVLRVLMQVGLAEGDMETVRNTAARLIDVGIAEGQLMLTLEGVCLLRNVDGDTAPAIEKVLDALDARGFSEIYTADYPEWLPDIEEGAREFPTMPPAATILAMLKEKPLQETNEPFGWIALWPLLTRDSRRLLFEQLHFEMGKPQEQVLQPPRLHVAWIVSGELQITEQLFRCIPGSMIMRSPEEAKVITGRHLRVVGLNSEQWMALHERPDIDEALEQKRMRARAIHTLTLRAKDDSFPSEEQLRALLQSAQMRRLHEVEFGKDISYIGLLLEGRGNFNVEDNEAPEQELRPGTIIKIPPSTLLPDTGVIMLYWPENVFDAIIPVDSFSTVQLTAEPQDVSTT